MNIVFLLRLWPVYGGGETVTFCLANEMVKRGWNVSVLYFKEHTRKELPFIDSRIKAEKVEGVACDEFYANPASAPLAITALKEYIDRNHTEYIIDQWWPTSYIEGIKGYRGVKIVNCLHQAFFTPSYWGHGIYPILKKVLNPIYLYFRKRSCVQDTNSYLPLVDKYVFLSKRFQKQYQEMSGNQDPDNQLDAIPNPLVYSANYPIEELEKKGNIVLVVARMEETQKRISAILKAWRLIEQQYAVTDWKLQIVGEGRSLNDYKQMAKDFQLKNVSFEGFQDPIEYYKKSKIFLMSSYFEGFGMTLVECSQYAVVPVVMDSFLSLHDIIESGKNGVITPNGDIDTFAKELNSLMHSPQRITEYAKNALAMCQRFRVEHVVDMWEVLLKGIK